MQSINARDAPSHYGNILAIYGVAKMNETASGEAAFKKTNIAPRENSFQNSFILDLNNLEL